MGTFGVMVVQDACKHLNVVPIKGDPCDGRCIDCGAMGFPLHDPNEEMLLFLDNGMSYEDHGYDFVRCKRVDIPMFLRIYTKLCDGAGEVGRCPYEAFEWDQHYKGSTIESFISNMNIVRLNGFDLREVSDEVFAMLDARVLGWAQKQTKAAFTRERRRRAAKR